MTTGQTMHTPGPWKIPSDGPCSVDDQDGRWIAVTGCPGRDAEANKANARLIAAAPEMLKVLLRLVAPFDGAKGAGMDMPKATIADGSDMLANIRAAIAKATGAA